MNNTIEIFENISTLITSNSLYNKSIDTLDSNISIDQTIFQQLQIYLSKLPNQNDDVLSFEIDYLSPLFLFLLEHCPFEIDLNLLTSTQIDYQQISSNKKFYKPKLLSFIQHTSESEKILNQLYKYFQVKTINEFLCLKQNTQPIYLHCFHLLQPLLTKTIYNKYPIAIQLFVHITQSLSQSNLSEIFDFIFPICLITLDDPSIDMKFISLCLLDYLQRNSTTTDLLLFNRANVIIYGLEQNLHRRDNCLIFFQCLLSTTYRWLIIIENEIYSGKHLFIRTSQLIERFIRDCLLEINIDYRRELLKILQVYIKRLELFSLRHLNHFIELLNDTIDNYLLRYNSLEILLIIFQLFKPRIYAHRYDFMKIIIRCLFKIIHEEKENKIIIQLLKKCLKEFNISTMDNYVQDALKSLIDTKELDLIYREYLQELLDSLKENS